jgi:hypothetical protein
MRKRRLSADFKRIYGYPKEAALRVATEAIGDFLKTHDLDVYLAVFDREAFSVSKKLLGEVKSYVDEHYISARRFPRQKRELKYLERGEIVPAERSLPYFAPQAEQAGLDSSIGNLDEPFSQTLLRLIDAKGKTDVEVYKRANIDRKLFSKIRTGKGYLPGKRTVLALAVALELSLEETEDLLRRAGYALSRSRIFDVIVEYFIVNKKYDIFEINEVLF